jgi:histidyl-tRNA synthetase
VKFQAIKGVRDILPPGSALWNRVEQAAREVFQSYGYGQIRLPIFEPTELFARSVGADTDIVSKEMYEFEDKPSGELADLREKIGVTTAADYLSGAQILDDELLRLFERYRSLLNSPSISSEIPGSHLRMIAWFNRGFDDLIKWMNSEHPEKRELINYLAVSLQSLVRAMKIGQSLSLRPEATASVVRAYIEHGMHTRPGNVKLYYMGPMFRRERPQKGRYRQFYQIGAELLGHSDHAALDAEVIEMLQVFFARIGLKGAVLEINSIGDRNCRPAYVERLRAELGKVRDRLGPDSQRRIETNPLRVLDSKLPEEQPVIETLPRIAENLCDACREHYADLKRQLALRGIIYRENWRLVRGLDYYMRTTFEITAPGLGSQNAVCGGGRYDGLVELLGGPATTKGIGFAIGTDRLILSLEQAGEGAAPSGLDVFLAWLGAPAYPVAVKLAQRLRGQGLAVELPAAEMKFGKSLNLADRLGARYAVILGEEELAAAQFTVKRLADGDQKRLSEADLLIYLLPRAQ